MCIRDRVGDVRGQLPSDIRGPYFNDEYTDVYTTLYAVQSADLGAAELQEVAEQIKRRLQSVPQVAKVNILGKPRQQVHVTFSSQRLAALGVSPALLMQALSRQNQVSPSGFQDTPDDRVHVLVSGGFQRWQDVRDVAITVGSRVVRVGDVATVTPGYEDPPSYTMRHQGAPALAIGVTMLRQGNIQQLGDDLAKRMAEVQAALPQGVTVTRYADQPVVVKASVWEFERAFLEALAIVLAVCFLFLGWRTGIVVAASIPLVLGLVAVVMHLMNWSLDRISLGALIIALGLLVDDAIIAVEMMVVKIEQGWDLSLIHI